MIAIFRMMIRAKRSASKRMMVMRQWGAERAGRRDQGHRPGSGEWHRQAVRQLCLGSQEERSKVGGFTSIQRLLPPPPASDDAVPKALQDPLPWKEDVWQPGEERGGKTAKDAQPVVRRAPCSQELRLSWTLRSGVHLPLPGLGGRQDERGGEGGLGG